VIPNALTLFGFYSTNPAYNEEASAICALRFAHASNPWKTLNEQAVAPAITSNRSFGTLALRVMLGVRSAWVLMMNLLNAEFLQAHTACCRG
jgi:hypothetical protein